MAVDHINAQGGVKALGGAKLKLVVLDSGDTTEKAKSAAQRMVAQEPDLVAASAAYLSSFTLAVTEVTERANLPVLTLSYSDLITDRGFKYVFQTSATAGIAGQAGAAANHLARGKRLRQEAEDGCDRHRQYRRLRSPPPNRCGRDCSPPTACNWSSTRPSRRRWRMRPRWFRRSAPPSPTCCSSCRRSFPTRSSCWKR